MVIKAVSQCRECFLFGFYIGDQFFQSLSVSGSFLDFRYFLIVHCYLGFSAFASSRSVLYVCSYSEKDKHCCTIRTVEKM